MVISICLIALFSNSFDSIFIKLTLNAT